MRGESGILVIVVPAKVDVAIAEVIHKLVAGSFGIVSGVDMRG